MNNMMMIDEHRCGWKPYGFAGVVTCVQLCNKRWTRWFKPWVTVWEDIRMISDLEMSQISPYKLASLYKESVARYKRWMMEWDKFNKMNKGFEV